MNQVAPAGPVYQAGTLSGNPLAMTAGIWALENLSTGMYRQLTRLGAQLATGLGEAAREAGVAAAGQPRRIGADALLHGPAGHRLYVGHLG